MDRARPRATALVAFVLATVVLLNRAFILSGIQRRMLDQLPLDRFTFWPGAIFAYLTSLLWVGLYVLLWPLIRDTRGSGWMKAALVCWSLGAVLGNSLPLLAQAEVGDWLLAQSSWIYSATSAANVGFVVCFAFALRRCELFPRWVTSAAFSWAGLRLLGIALANMNGLRVFADSELFQGISSFRGNVSAALEIAMLIGIGLCLWPSQRVQLATES